MQGVRARARDALLRSFSALRLDVAARALARRRGTVRVMNLHGTPGRDAAALENQLRWAAAAFEILRPETYLAILDGRVESPQRPSLVFTFDDGLASNAKVAAPILEALGLRAIFFVNPAFAEASGDTALRFFSTRIRPGLDTAALSLEDWTPMDREALRSLRRRGHLIGNHTRRHIDLRTVSGVELDDEVRGARDLLSNWMDEPIECFAWTFSWDAISAEAWALATATHRYCFTACPGANVDQIPTRIWRTNTEASLPAYAYRPTYSGITDPFWLTRRRRLAALHASIT